MGGWKKEAKTIYRNKFTPPESRTTILVVIGIFTVFATVVAALIHTTRPVTNLQSAGVQANQLMMSVGGTPKVCDEAIEIFKRFGVSKQIYLSVSELKDYPVVAALGTAHVILPGSPPRLSIRVGSHRDGFFIEIADTNSSSKYPKSLNTLELVDSQIFVHR
jgi:hypothetical protein